MRLPKKPKKRKSGIDEFSAERAKSLALSDRGSYYNQDEWLSEDTTPIIEAAELPATSASRTKIFLENGLGSETSTTTESSKDVETWDKLHGRTIVSGDMLQENLVKSVSCRFCHNNFELLENRTGRRGLGATWKVRCENHNCPSHSLTSSFPTTERGLCFDVNRALVLGMRTIGRGQSAAVRALSFLGLRPINKAYWTENTKRIEKEAKLILEEELNVAAFEVKEKKFALGEVESSPEELHEKVIDAGITIDASWSTRGWSASDGVVAAISVDTGKVLDVVHLSSTCAECTKMEEKKKGGSMSRLDWHRWFEKHEPNCFLNHDGSAAVSRLEMILCFDIKFLSNIRGRRIGCLGGRGLGYAQRAVGKMLFKGI